VLEYYINHSPTHTVKTQQYYESAVLATWAPAGMGKGGGIALWKCCKVFCALVVTVKRSVVQLFMRYLHNFLSASGASPDPHRGSTPGLRWGTVVSRPPNLPTPVKKTPAGAHG